ncbi:MAG: Zn-dependent hydrolase [Hydrogenophilales bacterium 12-63-5]|nr:MAG: Zn-dependent hydrolase [Hydrogenophilales bacterium 12-63-5]
MLFRQFFESESSTYTYLIASGVGREALIIDPVKEMVPHYLKAIADLDLKLVRAIDTHTHADHVTGLGDLRNETGCVTVMGEFTQAECVSEHVREGDLIDIDGVKLRAIYTPGHTNESFSFVLNPGQPQAVFTGDVLLIRGTGRNDDTLVYPAHDYKGWTASSIGEEKRHNPRLANTTREAYIELMNGLVLSNPKLMDIAIPANLACGRVAAK